MIEEFLTVLSIDKTDLQFGLIAFLTITVIMIYFKILERIYYHTEEKHNKYIKDRNIQIKQFKRTDRV